MKTKVYLVHKQTEDQIKLQIQPSPSTVIRAFDNEEAAINYLRKELESHEEYVFESDYRILTGVLGSLFIEKIEIEE